MVEPKRVYEPPLAPESKEVILKHLDRYPGLIEEAILGAFEGREADLRIIAELGDPFWDLWEKHGRFAPPRLP